MHDGNLEILYLQPEKISAFSIEALSRTEPVLKILSGVDPVFVKDALTAEFPTLSSLTSRGLARFCTLILAAAAYATNNEMARSFIMDERRSCGIIRRRIERREYSKNKRNS